MMMTLIREFYKKEEDEEEGGGGNYSIPKLQHYWHFEVQKYKRQKQKREEILLLPP